jgi:exodeoxyribonuclease VII large subunit
MQPDGKGSLALAFEQLKKKLASEGLFDQSRKKPIPKIPKRIGVITSPTGAAVRDVINVVTRRFPYAEILIYPALVQGAGSAASLIGAVEYFDKTSSCDVLIIGRGGGSIEELWSFNDEGLARAIYKCRIPVISAVGHETDFTICDFVADLRAPTPSAAAELAAPDTAKLLKQFSNITTLLNKYLTNRLEQCRLRLDRLQNSPALTSAGYLIDEKNMQLLRLTSELERAGVSVVRDKRMQFTEKVAKLEALNPMSVLTRGFSAVYKDSKLLKSVSDVQKGDTVTVRMKDGTLVAACTDVLENTKG